MPILPLLVLAASINSPGKKRIIVVAHRAAHERAPENSLSAICEAIRIGADYVELDVRLTKDGGLVLMHDRNVDRTTDGHGEVSALTKAEIDRLRFKANGEEGVPTFDQALALCKGKMRVYVDNKAGPPAQVIEAIERHGMLDRVVIYDGISNLREFKRLRPKVWIMPDHPDSLDELRRLASELKPETVDGNVRRWTKDQAEAAHALGVQVWVDNLGENDNEAGWNKSVEMGVDAIQTDHPTSLIAFLQSNRLRPPPSRALEDNSVITTALKDMLTYTGKDAPAKELDYPVGLDIRSSSVWPNAPDRQDYAFDKSRGNVPALDERTISELRENLWVRNRTRKAFRGIVSPDRRVKIVDSEAKTKRTEPYERVITPYIPGYSADGRHAIARFSFPWSIHSGVATYLLERSSTGWQVIWRSFIYYV